MSNAAKLEIEILEMRRLVAEYEFHAKVHGYRASTDGSYQNEYPHILSNIGIEIDYKKNKIEDLMRTAYE